MRRESLKLTKVWQNKCDVGGAGAVKDFQNRTGLDVFKGLLHPAARRCDARRKECFDANVGIAFLVGERRQINVKLLLLL